MKSQKKKIVVRQKKQQPRPNMEDQDSNTVDLGGYGAVPTYNMLGGAGTDTITLGAATGSYNYNSLTSPSMVTTTTIPNGGYILSSGTASTYAWNPTPSIYGSDASVSINTDGLTMKAGADIMVGDKSLMKSIEKIEERLAILHPNQALEDRWEQLKDLRQQYIDLEKELLEKEKMWKILKEK